MGDSAHDTPGELATALEELRSSLKEDAAPDRWRMDITIVGLLAAVFGVLVWHTTLSERQSAPTVALSVHSELVGELQWVGPGFAQVLAAYAGAGDRLLLYFDGDVSDTLLGRDVLVMNGSLPEVEHEVRVELIPQNGDGGLTVEVHLRSRDGRESRQTSLRGESSALSDLASRVALQLFTWLEIDAYTASERSEAIAAIPEDSAAARPYVLGLESLRRGEGRAAVEYFSQSLAADSDHPMLNAALAEALDFLGYRARAVQQIQAAYDQRGVLSREKQLSIEARLRLLQNDWQAAESLYAALMAFYPEDISYGLALAETQYRGSRMKEAEATLVALRQHDAFADDPRLDLLEARMWRQAGNWQRGVAAAERAVEKAQAQGRSGLLARALVHRADMDGDPKGLGLELAAELFEEMRDPHGVSLVLREQGDRHKAAGRLAEAAAAYDEARRVSAEVGNEAEIASALQARAIVHDLNGELQAGYELKREVLKNYQRRGVHAGAAIMMENIGVSLYKMGRLAEARQVFAQATPEFARLNDQIGVAWAPYQLGRVMARMGLLDEARRSFEEALVNARIHPEGYLELHTRFELARLDLFEQRDGVQQTLEALAGAYREEALHLDYADTLVLLARHALLLERPDDALRQAQEAAEIFADSDARYYQVAADTQRLRAGDVSVCGTLPAMLDGLQHRETVLLARASLARCEQQAVDATELLAEARALSLFEAELAATALLDPMQARTLADTRGWRAAEYWSGP